MSERGIIPNLTDDDLIPETLLKTICCGCETGCESKRCSCRKHGLKCTNLCTNCHGSDQCSNIEVFVSDDLNESEDFEEVITNTAGHEEIEENPQDSEVSEEATTSFAGYEETEENNQDSEVFEPASKRQRHN